MQEARSRTFATPDQLLIAQSQLRSYEQPISRPRSFSSPASLSSRWPSKEAPAVGQDPNARRLSRSPGKFSVWALFSRGSRRQEWTVVGVLVVDYSMLGCFPRHWGNPPPHGLVVPFVCARSLLLSLYFVQGDQASPESRSVCNRNWCSPGALHPSPIALMLLEGLV